MMPHVCFSLEKLLPRRKKKEEEASDDRSSRGRNSFDRRLPGHNSSIHCNSKRSPTVFPLRSTPTRDSSRIKEEELTGFRTDMGNKVTTISDIINRVASSCLSYRVRGGRALEDLDYDGELEQDLEEYHNPFEIKLAPGAQEKEEEEEEEGQRGCRATGGGLDTGREIECFMQEVFDAVLAARRAYVGLQVAHSPWDPDKTRVADARVVAELRNLGRLRDRFRRSFSATTTSPCTPPLREVVAPYEAAIEDLKRELKAKEAELESLKEKLRNATPCGLSRRRGRTRYSKRVGCISALTAEPPAGYATPEMFVTYMEEVKTATMTFTGHLLSLMRSARWDIAAAVRSIINGGMGGGIGDGDGGFISDGFDPQHAKCALESYVNRKIFQGFEDETFNMDGSLGSQQRPAEFRRDCFAQFRDMKGMDPAELLGVLPTCQFGQFAAKKYEAVVHARMEESLFGSTEQRRQVMAGAHPRTGFYAEFLRVAKAVWLLHLLAFALDPPPCHFEASKGAEFHPEYMESVTKFSFSGRIPAGSVVGFPVAPGFKLGDGSVIRARVYLLPGPWRL